LRDDAKPERADTSTGGEAVIIGTGIIGGTTDFSSFLSKSEGKTGKGGSVDVTEDNPGGREGVGVCESSGIKKFLLTPVNRILTTLSRLYLRVIKKNVS